MEDFSHMMTDKAKQIGCLNTTFKNAHGLDEEGHLSTAYDMAIIASYMYNNEILKEVVGMKVATIKINDKSVNLKNTNRLLKTNKYVKGGKTGYTGNADRCLAEIATKDDFSIITIVLGATDTNIRFNTADKLINKTFDMYKVYNLEDKLKWDINIPVIKGTDKYYNDSYFDSLKIPLIEYELEDLVIKENIVKVLNAPVYKSKYLGNIEVKIGNESILYKDIYSNYSIDKMSIVSYFKVIINGI